MVCSPLLHSLSCHRLARDPQHFGGRAPFASKPVVQPHTPRRCADVLQPCTVCKSQRKGFGASSSKSKRRSAGGALQESNPEWVPVAMVSEFKEGKPTLPKILRDNTAIVLYKVGEELYCSDANSTAFKFPLIDANIIEREGGPAVEVPLDGTVYDLETGEVLTWCPKDNPIRFILGSLKANDKPAPLRVYPARLNDNGKIFVKFTRA